MIIACFYVKLHAATYDALDRYADTAFLIDTSENNHTYYNELVKLWTGKDTLCVIEQDIEIDENVLPTFDKCPEPWCVYDYELNMPGNYMKECLGCTKFSPELQRQVDLSVIPRQNRHWKGLDVSIRGEVKRQAGQKNSHCHGTVMHHHLYRDPATVRPGEGTIHERNCQVCKLDFTETSVKAVLAFFTGGGSGKKAMS